MKTEADDKRRHTCCSTQPPHTNLTTHRHNIRHKKTHTGVRIVCRASLSEDKGAGKAVRIVVMPSTAQTKVTTHRHTITPSTQNHTETDDRCT